MIIKSNQTDHSTKQTKRWKKYNNVCFFLQDLVVIIIIIIGSIIIIIILLFCFIIIIIIIDVVGGGFFFFWMYFFFYNFIRMLYVWSFCLFFPFFSTFLRFRNSKTNETNEKRKIISNGLEYYWAIYFSIFYFIFFGSSKDSFIHFFPYQNWFKWIGEREREKKMLVIEWNEMKKTL